MYRVSVGTMLCDHRKSFATLLDKEVCEWLYISPHTLQDYRDRKIIPYTQFAGKILYKASDLEWLLEEKYKVQAGEYSLYLLECMKRRKLYENLQINTNLPRNREKNSAQKRHNGTHVKTHKSTAMNMPKGQLVCILRQFNC